MDPVQKTGLTPPRGKPSRPGWLPRLLAVAFYFGLAPVLRPLRLGRDDPFVRHHATQALTIIFLLLVTFAADFLYWLVLSCVLVYRRAVYESLPVVEGWSIQTRDAIPIVAGLLMWFLVWLTGLALALLGSARPLPLLGRLTRRPRLLRVAFTGNVLLLFGAALTTALSLHASSLTRDDDAPAPVYVLYDDMGYIPRWVFNLASYRISREATARWGPGSVVVAPLDEHHLRLALAHGRFVFLACHGIDGEIESSLLRVSPCPFSATEQATPRRLYVMSHDGDTDTWRETDLEVGQDLQFLYNSACESGSKADEWERALSPAEVRTFDRLSAVAEHGVWLWIRGPARLRDIN